MPSARRAPIVRAMKDEAPKVEAPPAATVLGIGGARRSERQHGAFETLRRSMKTQAVEQVRRANEGRGA